MVLVSGARKCFDVDFSANFLVEQNAILLKPVVADVEAELDEVPVLRTVTSALKLLGCALTIRGWMRAPPGTIVFAKCLSAHKELAIIKLVPIAGFDKLD